MWCRGIGVGALGNARKHMTSAMWHNLCCLCVDVLVSCPFIVGALAMVPGTGRSARFRGRVVVFPAFGILSNLLRYEQCDSLSMGCDECKS